MCGPRRSEREELERTETFITYIKEVEEGGERICPLVQEVEAEGGEDEDCRGQEGEGGALLAAVGVNNILCLASPHVSSVLCSPHHHHSCHQLTVSYRVMNDKFSPQQ